MRFAAVRRISDRLKSGRTLQAKPIRGLPCLKFETRLAPFSGRKENSERAENTLGNGSRRWASINRVSCQI